MVTKIFLLAAYLRRPGKNIAEPAAPVRDKEVELPLLRPDMDLRFVYLQH